MLHQPVLPFATHHTRRFCGANAADPARAEGLPPVTAILRDTPAGDDPGLPRESLDTPEDLPKESRCRPARSGTKSSVDVEHGILIRSRQITNR